MGELTSGKKSRKKARKIGLLELTFYVFSRILNLQIHAHIYRSFIRHHKMLGVRIAKRKIEPQKPANPCDTRLCSCIFSVNTRQEQRTCAAGPLLFSLNGQKKIRILKLWSFGRGSTGVRLSSAIPLLHLRRSDKQHCIPRKIYNAVRACLSSPFRPQSK